jgi:hypothetical protein
MPWSPMRILRTFVIVLGIASVPFYRSRLRNYPPLTTEACEWSNRQRMTFGGLQLEHHTNQTTCTFKVDTVC